MKEYRAAWAAIILSATLMYMFANGTVTLSVLLLAICLPALSLGLSLLQGKYIKIALEGDIGDDSNSFRISVTNRSIIPVAHAFALMEFKNLRTGGLETLEIPLRITPFCKREIPVTQAMTHYGKYQICLTSVKMYDALRLRPIIKVLNERAYHTVRPEVFPIRLEVSGNSSAMADEDRYSDRKSGNDPGEVRAIHEYVPGDPVRNIHWKLSEKVDKLLVKELGLPVTDRFMAIADTSVGSRTDEKGMDVIAAVFTSILEALRSEGMEFSAGWIDADGKELSLTKINDEVTLANVKELFLSVPNTESNLCNRILALQAGHRSAHLIIIGAEIPHGIDMIAASSKVTLLLYNHPNSISLEDGLSIYGYGADTYNGDLRHIEI